jgi:hypothetical protein
VAGVRFVVRICDVGLDGYNGLVPLAGVTVPAAMATVWIKRLDREQLSVGHGESNFV